ncbi:MAG: hypothetical protein AB7G47_19940 [Mycolicibacterium sp.]|uniref:hypothetical protein n=1 Tax=Mycolicibacterium sp. TaxID=2320850 RepID=UPI003D1270FD
MTRTGEYRVTWTIDLSADSAEHAARKALAIHRNPVSIATVFQVQPHEVSREAAGMRNRKPLVKVMRWLGPVETVDLSALDGDPGV